MAPRYRHRSWWHAQLCCVWIQACLSLRRLGDGDWRFCLDFCIQFFLCSPVWKFENLPSPANTTFWSSLRIVGCLYLSFLPLPEVRLRGDICWAGLGIPLHESQGLQRSLLRYNVWGSEARKAKCDGSVERCWFCVSCLQIYFHVALNFNK